MQGFKEYLIEIFDSSVKWDEVDFKKYNNMEKTEYEFNIDQDEYLITIYYHYGYVNKLEIMIEIESDDSEKRFDLLYNSKNQFKVYSTVFDITKSYVKKYNIEKGVILELPGTSTKQNKMYKKIFEYLVRKNVVYKDSYKYRLK